MYFLWDRQGGSLFSLFSVRIASYSSFLLLHVALFALFILLLCYFPFNHCYDYISLSWWSIENLSTSQRYGVRSVYIINSRAKWGVLLIQESSTIIYLIYWLLIMAVYSTSQNCFSLVFLRAMLPEVDPNILGIYLANSIAWVKIHLHLKLLTIKLLGYICDIFSCKFMELVMDCAGTSIMKVLCTKSHLLKKTQMLLIHVF